MEIVLALLYLLKQSMGLLNIFRTSISGGNFDLFYIFSIILFFYILYKKKDLRKKMIKDFIICFSPILIYGLFQSFFVGEIVRLVVNISKIGVCLFLFCAIKNYDFKFNYKKFIYILSTLYLIFTIIALLLPKSIFWVLNDYVNLYTLNRLRLFYFEASELGFQLSFVILFIVYFIIKSKSNKEKVIYSLILFIYLVMFNFSRPYGATVILIFSICLMLLIYIKNNYSKAKLLKTYALMFVSLIVVIVFLAVTKNTIYLRTMDTLNGRDRSNGYRINVALNVTKASLINTHGMGVGFGNLSTTKIRNEYQKYGLFEQIASSYLYFITEGGLFSIIYLFILLTILILKVSKNKFLLNYGLLSFIILYQIFAGYFTNPMNWIIYALIFKFSEDSNSIEGANYEI